jgi:Arc/MetJ family transcription regulator
MGRTNVEIDDRLIGRVMSRYRLPSKRAAIDFALHRVDVEPLTREETLAMRGTGWEGDLDRLRSGYLSPRPPHS